MEGALRAVAPRRRAAREVTSAGRSTSEPVPEADGVGASGSKQVTTKLLVPRGSRTSSAAARCCPLGDLVVLRGWPSVTSVLVSRERRHGGSRSYGSGATGRSRFMSDPNGPAGVRHPLGSGVSRGSTGRSPARRRTRAGRMARGVAEPVPAHYGDGMTPAVTDMAARPLPRTARPSRTSRPQGCWRCSTRSRPQTVSRCTA